ncbi:MAG: TolC family protein [Treponema sp.]|nr:TolC family protein [Treponema sp.]
MLKHYIKTLLATGIFLCVPLFAQAETEQRIIRLNPAEAVELAIKNNLDLEAMRINTTTARRTSNLAWNQFIPAVDVGGTIHRSNTAPDNTFMGMPLPPEMIGHRWGASGFISTTLNINFAMFAEMNRLRLDYERGLISYTNAMAQLERDIRKAYHNILLMKEYIAMLNLSLENAERQVEIAQINFNAGVTSEISLLHAQVARETLRPVIDQAEGGLRLSMLLGLPHDTQFELIPVTREVSPTLPNTTELIRRAAAGQPDIQALRHDILIMDSIRKTSNLWLFTPTLTLSWNADPAFNRDPWNNNWFDRNRWDQQTGATSFSIGFRLNGLFPFGAERQNIRAIDDQIRIAHIGLAQMIRGTEIEIHGLVLTLERIQLSMEALQQTVTLAELSYLLTEEAYRIGRADLTQIQSAEQLLRQARIQLHEEQFNYLNGILDLEYALGVPFGSLN